MRRADVILVRFVKKEVVISEVSCTKEVGSS